MTMLRGKQYFLTTLLVAISSVVYGQWTPGPSLIYYNGGNVGIGLSNPGARLTIQNNSTGMLSGFLLRDGVGNNRGAIYYNGAQDFVIDALSAPVGDISTFKIRTGSMDRFIITSEGNVGLGIIAPQAKFEVLGNQILRKTTSTDYTSLRLYNDVNSAVRALEIDYSGTTYSGSLLAGGVTGEAASITTTGAYPLMFGTSNTHRVTISSTGFVGINNTQPAGLLDIKTNSAPQLHLSTSRGFGNSRNWAIGTNWNAEGDFSVISGLSTGAAPAITRFLIDVNGNVGVNNLTPYGLLDIKTSSNPQLYLSTTRGYGTSRNWAIGTNWNTEGDFSILSSTTNGAAPTATKFVIDVNGNVGINNTTPVGLLDIRTSSNPQLYLTTTRSFGTSRNWAIGTNWNAEGDFTILEGSTNGANPSLPRLTIDVLGNVGIGTHTPDTKLTVKGVIHTNEVRVDLNSPIQGPDYVFEANYELLPLSQIEQYIKTNKRLPEVPSAQQMYDDGLNLKEMNLLLLKKVEELTLHLIEMKKENELQQTRIEKLERENKKK
jgi:hypothetical protein